MPRSVSSPCFATCALGACLIVGGVAAPAARGQYSSTDPVGTAMSNNTSRTLGTLGAPSGGDFVRPEVIFFPPNPPPLGVMVRFPTGEAARPSGAPAQLRPYVTEIFYAPLSTQLSRGGNGRGRGETALHPKHQALLDAFDSQRLRLLEELRTRIATLAPADAATRREEHVAFARLQADALAQLEEKAEGLRAALSRNASWYALRQWKLGRGDLDKPREENRVLEAQLVRAAAYHQAALSQSQRRLLREIAMEMESDIYARGDPVPLDRFFLFFLPETAQFRLPDQMSASLASRIKEFRAAKDALKDELSEAVYELDAVVFTSARRNSLAELAVAQAGRFAELDRMAEEIRGELLHAPGNYRLEALPPLPGDLEPRIQAYQRDAAAYARRRTAQGEAAAREVERPNRDASSEAFREYRDRQREAREVGQQKFDRENATERRALEDRLEKIRLELSAIEGLEIAFSSGRHAGAVLTEYMNVRRQRQAYSEYGYAVLEPGLSPAQRRLLFGGAIENLNLPLPGAEFQPVYAPKTIVR